MHLQNPFLQDYTLVKERLNNEFVLSHVRYRKELSGSKRFDESHTDVISKRLALLLTMDFKTNRKKFLLKVKKKGTTYGTVLVQLNRIAHELLNIHKRLAIVCS